MMVEKELKSYSKFMSLVLRHQPQIIGLTLTQEGWANTDDLIDKMNAHGCALTREILEHIVETNSKKRFSFNADHSQIRANQGHSINIDLQLEAGLAPDILYHGTAAVNEISILSNGIEKRDRQHVHLSSNIQTAREVGQRHGKPIVLEIDSKAMLVAGFKFYLSENKVWLTDFVPPQYIKKRDQ